MLVRLLAGAVLILLSGEQLCTSSMRATISRALVALSIPRLVSVTHRMAPRIPRRHPCGRGQPRLRCWRFRSCQLHRSQILNTAPHDSLAPGGTPNSVTPRCTERDDVGGVDELVLMRQPRLCGKASSPTTSLSLTPQPPAEPARAGRFSARHQTASRGHRPGARARAHVGKLDRLAGVDVGRRSVRDDLGTGIQDPEKARARPSPRSAQLVDYVDWTMGDGGGMRGGHSRP